MKLILPKGATSVSVDVFIRDSSVTTGAGLTGLVYNTASLTAYYRRPGGTATAITLATLANAQAAFSSGGFVAVDGTNMPGVYRLDIPDAVLASGVNQAVIMLKGATNMEPCTVEIQLSDVNLNDAVRAGLTALPNVASGSAGAVITAGTGTAQLSTTSGQVLLQNGTGTGQVGLTSGRVTANVTAIGGTVANATNLAASTSVILTGTVSNTGLTPTSTQFECSDITEATTDHYVGRLVIFTSGALLNQAARITAYSLQGGRGRFTVTTMTEAPANADTLVIV